MAEEDWRGNLQRRFALTLRDYEDESRSRAPALSVLVAAPHTGAASQLADLIRERLGRLGYQTVTPEEFIGLGDNMLLAEVALLQSVDYVILVLDSPGAIGEGLAWLRPGIADKTLVFVAERNRGNLLTQPLTKSGALVRFYSDAADLDSLAGEAQEVASSVAAAMLWRQVRGKVESLRDRIEDDPRRFERECLDILRNSGLAVVQGLSGPDMGVDIVAYGQMPFSPRATKVLAQCKLLRAPLKVDEVRTFAHKVSDFQADYGVIFVSSTAQKAARRAAAELGVSVVDGAEIRRLTGTSGGLGGDAK